MEGSARELLAQAEHAEETESRSAKDDAREFIENYLAGGCMPSDALMEAARRAGHKPATVRRAMKDLQVQSDKDGLGMWFKSLPTSKMLKNPEDAH